jgi:hypothetical protein
MTFKIEQNKRLGALGMAISKNKKEIIFTDNESSKRKTTNLKLPRIRLTYRPNGFQIIFQIRL